MDDGFQVAGAVTQQAAVDRLSVLDLEIRFDCLVIQAHVHREGQPQDSGSFLLWTWPSADVIDAGVTLVVVFYLRNTADLDTVA